MDLRTNSIMPDSGGGFECVLKVGGIFAKILNTPNKFFQLVLGLGFQKSKKLSEIARKVDFYTSYICKQNLG
jgi:hypothetical protein